MRAAKASPPLAITVVIPVYNAANFVEAAVASALQCSEVQEVLLIDDAGPDDSLAVCEALVREEPRVKLYRHPGGVNKGASASRNLGVAMATQPYIAFLDADDLFLPNRFEAEHRIFTMVPDADGVYGAIDAYFHDAEGRARFEQRGLPELTTVHLHLAPEQLFNGLIGLIPGTGHFSLNAFTVKRHSLLNCGQRMNEALNMNEDTEYLVRLAYHLRLYAGSIEKAVARRGVHAENRITRTRSGDAHASRMYAALIRWGRSVGVPPEALDRFLEKGLTARAHAARGVLERGAVMLQIALRPRLWRRHNLRDAALGILAKRETWLGAKLHKLGWAVYGHRRI